MTRREVLSLAVWVGFMVVGALAAEDELRRDFLTPPSAAKPWIMWFWISDFVSKEAVTYDLEAYHRAGIGGVLLFPNYEHVAGWGWSFAPKSVKDRAQPLSDAWYECVRHAIRECDRLGMKIAFHNGPGYSGAGGPWVSVEQSMRRLVQSQKVFQGPGALPGTLPAAGGLDYRDVAVLACPMPPATVDPEENPKPAVTANSSHPRYPLERALDRDEETFWVSNGEKAGQAPTPAKPEWIAMEYAEPFTAGALLFVPRPEFGPRDCQIQQSDDGQQWKTLKTFTADIGPVQIEFEPASARFFRLLITSSQVQENTQIAEIAFLKPGQKALPSLAASDILDLSNKLLADGRVDWQASAGRWKIIRLGHISTGQKIHPASPVAEGFECDKMSVAAVTHHLEKGLIGRILALEPQLNGKTVVGVELDSYEGGNQDWTPTFRDEFRKRRGYDPLPWLPAWHAGVTIETPDMSARFRQDMHRTIAELHADVYYDTVAAFCRQRKVQLYTEAYGTPLWDPVTNAGRADVPTAEFWMGQAPGQAGQCMPTVRLMSSAAHTLGKPVVSAEAFTYGPKRDPWWLDPYALKAVGDQAYCLGLNHTILTESALQVWLDRVKPGMTFDAWGTPFNPGQTWWEPGRAWMVYQARCHAMLQQGRPVADILTLAPFAPGQDAWGPPAGIAPVHRQYNYDLCAEEVFVQHARCDNGQIVLPGGAYPILHLVHCDKLRPQTLTRIAELIERGATVVGPKPTGCSGREGYPDKDRQMREMADRLWGKVDGKSATENRVGQGRVVFGRHPNDVLKEVGLPPDVNATTQNIHWTHRQVGETDIYFLSNQDAEDTQTEVTFRVTGKMPELWDPVAGEMRPLPEFRSSETTTAVPLQFAPHQSYFVVFRTGPARMEGKNFPELSPVATIAGPWEVSFDPKWGGPEKVTFEKLEDWTARPEEGIKYYSGTAVYSCQFEISKPKSETFLDLGVVKNLAEVSLNGQPLGIVWCPPWRVRIPAGVLRDNRNELEIRVTNTWVNRLIGDERQPDDAAWSEEYPNPAFSPANTHTRSLLREPEWLAKDGRRTAQGRYAFVTYKHLRASDKLQESGLLGPVRFLREQ